MKLFNIYRKLPVFIQQLVVSLYSYKIQRDRFGGEYGKLYKSLLESDKWSSEQVIQYKEKNIARIINHAYHHCRFYKELYDKHGVRPEDFKHLDDLKKFPLVTKEMLKNAGDEILADNFNKSDLIAYHTSGSTGTPLDFYWTKHNLQFYWAIVQRGRARYGLTPNDKHINFTGKIVVPVSQKKPPFWRYRTAQNQAMINMQHLTEEKVPAIVDYINKEKFKFIVGYPSIINSFAVIVNDLNLKIINVPKYFFSSSEKLYDNQRVEIEKAFPGIICIEHYGFSEQVSSASMRPGDDLYYEDFELGHLEVSKPIIKGNYAEGKMLATGFQNDAMPYIRYEIGDIGTFDMSSKGQQRIVNIEGRNGDYIITPEGAHIMRFSYIVKAVDSIKECQFIQREHGTVIMKIVKRENYNCKVDEQKLKNEIHGFISPTLKVEFEYVDHIERTKSGKFKAVISELKDK